MNRAVAMSAASALCFVLAAGCASTAGQASKAAAGATPARATEAAADANSGAGDSSKDLPATLDGEIQRARLLREKGDYDEAVRALAQLMLVAPDDARVVGDYGKVLAQQGHSREALQFLKRAVELEPGDWSLHSALGVAYDQLDDHASAKLAYERALALKPDEPSVLNNYAVSRMLVGDYAGAKRLFGRAEAEGVHNPKIEGNLAKLAALRPDSAAPATQASATSPAQAAQPAALSPRIANNSAPARPVPTSYINKEAGATATPSAAGVENYRSASQMLPSHTETAAIAPKAAPLPARQPTTTSLANASSQGSTVAIANPQPAPGVRAAIGAPKELAPQIVMEHVPFDPLAGPVKHTSATKLAAAGHKPKPATPKASEPPTPDLRTAADGN